MTCCASLISGYAAWCMPGNCFTQKSSRLGALAPAPLAAKSLTGPGGLEPSTGGKVRTASPSPININTLTLLVRGTSNLN